ncbi:MAG: thiamine-monophosphate kinase [Candidatus Omnitrophota bacterium]|nr:MAG: thiamine-monophosphate kinase [Candidatus Omnitrophota bacterium]
MQKIIAMDELQFIDFLRKKAPKMKGVIRGIGDDCAQVKVGKETLLLKSDLFIEGVHFKKKDMTYKSIGMRAVARVLSDFAACGGAPKFIGISLGRPKDICGHALNDIVSGVNFYSRKYKFSLIGGDTARSQKLFLDVWGLGTAKEFISRSSAKAGDAIFLSGPLGARPFNKPFEPRLEEAKYLKSFKVNSMIDVSDGFIIDFYRILKMSKKGALLYEDSIPCTKGKSDFYRGEDYELIFTVDKKEQRLNELKKRFYFVGEIKNKDFGYKIKRGSSIKKVSIGGYTHF